MAASDESGANRGRLRGSGEPGWRAVDGVGEAGVPAAELVGEVVGEHTGADLKEEVRASWRPAHLLLLHHPLADDLVDGGLGEGTGDDLASPVTLAVVGDAGGVGPQVAAELAAALHSLRCSGPAPSTSRSNSRSSTVCSARKTLPCQQNHLRGTQRHDSARSPTALDQALTVTPEEPHPPHFVRTACAVVRAACANHPHPTDAGDQSERTAKPVSAASTTAAAWASSSGA